MAPRRSMMGQGTFKVHPNSRNINQDAAPLLRGRRNGVSLLNPPPLACGKLSKRVGSLTEFMPFPILEKRSIPQTPNRKRTFRRPSPLSCFRLAFYKSCHHSHALGPLWPKLTTSNSTHESSNLNENQMFSRSSSFQNVLNIMTKNIKMKLSRESADDFEKTVLS